MFNKNGIPLCLPPTESIPRRSRENVPLPSPPCSLLLTEWEKKESLIASPPPTATPRRRQINRTPYYTLSFFLYRHSSASFLRYTPVNLLESQSQDDSRKKTPGQSTKSKDLLPQTHSNVIPLRLLLLDLHPLRRRPPGYNSPLPSAAVLFILFYRYASVAPLLIRSFFYFLIINVPLRQIYHVCHEFRKSLYKIWALFFLHLFESFSPFIRVLFFSLFQSLLSFY